MWIVSELAVHPRTYSFGSSGQGVHEDLALRAGDQELVNMLRLVDWSEDPVQVTVCDACGTVGCASGDYVAVRRLGDHVAMAPPTNAYVGGAGEFEKAQYVEAWFIRKRGVPLVLVPEWSVSELKACGCRHPIAWSRSAGQRQCSPPRSRRPSGCWGNPARGARGD
jgi:hypothetical protein